MANFGYLTVNTVGIFLLAAAAGAQSPKPSAYRTALARCDIAVILRNPSNATWRNALGIGTKQGKSAEIKAIIAKAADDCLDQIARNIALVPAADRGPAGVPGDAQIKADIAALRVVNGRAIEAYTASPEFRSYLDGPDFRAALAKQTMNGATYTQLYRQNIDKCDYAAAMKSRPPEQIAQIRKALADPDREQTARVEGEIRAGTTAVQTCIDKAATTLAAIPVAAVSPEERRTVDADLKQRRTAAPAAVRAYFTSLGYRASTAARKPEPGYFFCVAEYQEIVDGRWTDLNVAMKSTVVADADIGLDSDREGLRATERGLLTQLRAYVAREQFKARGKLVSSLSEQDGNCYTEDSRREADAKRAAQEGTNVAFP